MTPYPYELRRIHRLLESPAKYPFSQWRRSVWRSHKPEEGVDYVVDSEKGHLVTLAFLLQVLERRFENPNAKSLYFKLINENLQEAS